MECVVLKVSKDDYTFHRINKTRAMCHWSATKVHDVTLLTVVLKSEEKQKHTGLLNMVPL